MGSVIRLFLAGEALAFIGAAVIVYHVAVLALLGAGLTVAARAGAVRPGR